MALTTITKVDVPFYLVGSEFYNSLCSEDDEEFDVPSANLKTTTEVESPTDLLHLLHTIQYWGLKEVPPSIIAYLLEKHPSDVVAQVLDVLQQFEIRFQFGSLYKEFQRATTPKLELEAVIRCGREDVFEYMVKVRKLQVSKQLVQAIAEHGYFALLETVGNTIPTSNAHLFTNLLLTKVAAGGHTDCVRYLLSKGCKKSSGTCLAATENGHFDCLVVAHTSGCTWDYKVIEAATRRGHIRCLKYALEHECPLGSSGTNVAEVAAQKGHFECLQCLIEHGCPVNSTVADAAAGRGHLNCLRYLQTRGGQASSIGVHAAAEHGHVECLRFMCHNGVLLDTDKLKAAVYYPRNADYVRSLVEAGFQWSTKVNLALVAVNARNAECLQYLCTHTTCTLTEKDALTAVQNNDLPTLQVLCNNGCPMSALVCSAAAQCDNATMLECLHRVNCPWDENTPNAAVRAGSYECLRYAVQRGCPLSPSVCDIAAECGHLHMRTYLHEKGAVLTRNTCLAAVKHGQISCLRYCVEHGAPLDATLCAAAAAYNNDKDCAHVPLLLLRYLHEEAHCPWDVSTCHTAARLGRHTLLVYAREHGCPWDASVSRAAGVSPVCLRYCVEHGCPMDEVTMQVYNKRRGM